MPLHHPYVLSPPSSLSCIHSDSEEHLNLADFLAEENTAPRSSASTLQSAADPSLRGETSITRSNIDSILARCSRKASKRSFNWPMYETDFEGRTQSPVVRQIMTEVSGELRETHDALMKCLYAPEELEDYDGCRKGDGDHVKDVKESGYRWRPSLEELDRIYEGAEDESDKRSTRERSVDRSSERTVVRMRGGGMQEFFGLKKTQPERPQIISRPSDAFKQMARPTESTSSPSLPSFEETRAEPRAPQDARLLRVQQAERLASHSFTSNDGLCSFTGSGNTASIVPEGSVASYYIGIQSRPGTLFEPTVGNEPRVSPSGFPSPTLPLTTGGRNKTLHRKPSQVESDHSESTVRNAPLPVELPTREQQEYWDSSGHIFRSMPGPSHNMDVNTNLKTEVRVEKPYSVRRLGSPMQSPKQDTWDDIDRSPRRPCNQSGLQPPSSGHQKNPQTTFFAPQGHAEFGKSVKSSLRKNRHPIRQNQAADYPLPVASEQDAGPHIYPPGSALSSNVALSPENRAETRVMEAEPPDCSIWQGGDHSSINPGDSASEVDVNKTPPGPSPPQGHLSSKQRQSENTKPVLGKALTEVGERKEMGRGAKERSEGRFREEIRKVWSRYQTRMRMINEDMDKTAEEKERLAKEEHRVLELLIGQASTDTGFEQLHEPWQKDQFAKDTFGNRSKPSGTPAIFRKANKVMKWFLAVRSDPKLKTWSTRRRGPQYSRLGAASSRLQTKRTNATGTHVAQSRSTPLDVGNQYSQQEEGGVALSPDRRRHFHFAPNPIVTAQTLHRQSFETLEDTSQATSAQVKAGKMHYGLSVASSEAGWPTQSQVEGGR